MCSTFHLSHDIVSNRMVNRFIWKAVPRVCCSVNYSIFPGFQKTGTWHTLGSVIPKRHGETVEVEKRFRCTKITASSVQLNNDACLTDINYISRYSERTSNFEYLTVKLLIYSRRIEKKRGRGYIINDLTI